MQAVNTVKIHRIETGLVFVCACGTVLVEQDDMIVHDQFYRFPVGGKGNGKETGKDAAKQPAGGQLDETKPIACKWAGARFEVPTFDLKQVQS